MPGTLGWQVLHQCFAVVEHLAHGVRFHGDLAAGIDQIGAERSEESSYPVLGVSRHAHRQAEGIAGLVQLLCGHQE